MQVQYMLAALVKRCGGLHDKKQIFLCLLSSNYGEVSLSNSLSALPNQLPLLEHQ